MEVSPEMAVTRRPSSPKSKEDMASYTHSQMFGLLKPFADRVLAIEHSVGELLGRMDGGETRADGHESRLSDAGAWSQQIKGDLASMRAHQVAMQNHLGQMEKDKVQLEQDRDEAQATTQQLNVQLQSVAELGPQLKQTLDENVARVDQLFAELAEQRTVLQNHIEGVVKQELQELASKQEQSSYDIQQAQTQLNSTLLSLDETKKSYAKNKRDDDKSFANLNSELTRLKTSLIEMDSRTSKQGEEIKANSATVKTAKESLDVFSAEKSAFQAQSDKLTNQVLNLQVRFVPVEKGLAGLVDAANRPMTTVTKTKTDKKDEKKDEPVKSGRNVAEFLADIEELVSKNNTRLDEISNGGSALETRLSKEVDGINQQVQHLHSSFISTDNQVKQLETMHADAIQKIEESMNLHNDFRTEMDTKTLKLEDIHGDVQSLTKQTTDSKDALSKLGMSVGLCNEHFSGLRKGLRDASGRVVGSHHDALLPETTHLRAMTPTLPNMRGLKSPSLGLAGTPRNMRPHSVMGTATTTASGQAWASPAFATSGLNAS